jgi:hypothetical protein
MPAKTIQQQPVQLKHVSQVLYVVHEPSGAIDTSYVYRPVDETGAFIGEARALTDTKTGAAAVEIVDWITSHVVPEINAHEGT